MPIVNEKDGTITDVQIFVAVLPASGYAFVTAIPSQKKRDFIEAHCDMVEYFGGVSELFVPDNLKSAVTTANNFDPDVNADYIALARHYNEHSRLKISTSPAVKAFNCFFIFNLFPEDT